MVDNFFEYDLTDRIPYKIQADDGLKLFTDLLNHTLNYLKPHIDNMPNNMDYDTMNPDFIPQLSSHLSYEYKYTQDRYYQADLIRSMLKAFNYRGTDADIITAVDNYNNEGWMAGEYFYPEYWKQYKTTWIEDNIDKVFIYSQSKHSGGHRFQDGSKWLHGVITIHTVDYLNDELKQAVDKVIPAGVKYIIATYTDSSTEEGDLLYLGYITQDPSVQVDITNFANLLEMFDIPKLLKQSNLNTALIHSLPFEDFTLSYPTDYTPKFYGVYIDDKVDNKANPYSYTWYPFYDKFVPTEGRNGTGVAFTDKDGTTKYKHFTFANKATGIKHSGSILFSENLKKYDLKLDKHFRDYFKVSPFQISNAPEFGKLLLDTLPNNIAQLADKQTYEYYGRFSSYYGSTNTVKHVTDSKPYQSNVWGLDGVNEIKQTNLYPQAFSTSAEGLTNFHAGIPTANLLTNGDFASGNLGGINSNATGTTLKLEQKQGQNWLHVVNLESDKKYRGINFITDNLDQINLYKQHDMYLGFDVIADKSFTGSFYTVVHYLKDTNIVEQFAVKDTPVLTFNELKRRYYIPIHKLEDIDINKVRIIICFNDELPQVDAYLTNLKLEVESKTAFSPAISENPNFYVANYLGKLTDKIYDDSEAYKRYTWSALFGQEHLVENYLFAYSNSADGSAEFTQSPYNYFSTTDELAYAYCWEDKDRFTTKYPANNLVVNTGFTKGWETTWEGSGGTREVTTSGIKITSSSARQYGIGDKLTIKISPGAKLRLSLVAKGTGYIQPYFLMSAGANVQIGEVQATDEFAKYEFTITFPNRTEAVTSLSILTMNADKWIEIKKNSVKLEIDSGASTVWTSASVDNDGNSIPKYMGVALKSSANLDVYETYKWGLALPKYLGMIPKYSLTDTTKNTGYLWTKV